MKMKIQAKGGLLAPYEIVVMDLVENFELLGHVALHLLDGNDLVAMWPR
jgi:hypothetical protein